MERVMGAILAESPMSRGASLHTERLIMSIGTKNFMDTLLTEVNELCGAEHCSVFQMNGTELVGCASISLDHSQASLQQSQLYVTGDFWRRDPALSEARAQIGDSGTSMIKVNIGEIPDTDLRDKIWAIHNIEERVLLWRGTGDSAMGISLCRSNRSGSFSSIDLSSLNESAITIMATLRKHAAVSWMVPRFPAVLTSLPKIEACLIHAPITLPRREFQVCARLIYGMTTTGIALELGIGEGSVMTYRKRAYERLNIASQRELLIWYLTIWDHMLDQVMGSA